MDESFLIKNKVIESRGNSPKWAEAENLILKENYLKKDRWNLFKILLPNRTRIAIKAQLSRLQLKNKIFYTKREDFFDTPNLLNNVIAGLIASDGCINDTKNHSRRLDLGFAEKDFNHWDKVKNYLEYNGPYYKSVWTKEFDFTKYKKYTSSGVFYSLCISRSDRWAEKLYEYWNITPRKTYTLEPPNIKDIEHIYAFLSGLLDGDGFICLNDKMRLSLAFLGTEKLLLWIKEQFDNLVPFDINNSPKQKDDSKVFIYYTSHWKSYALAKYFLSLDLLRMDRKWGKAYKAIQFSENNIIRGQEYKKLQSITNPKLKQLIGAVNWQIKGKGKKENAPNQ